MEELLLKDSENSTEINEQNLEYIESPESKINREIKEEIKLERKKVKEAQEFKKLRRTAKIINKILKTDRDAIVAVSGEPGEGKSTVIIWLMILMFKKFKLEKNVIFMPNEDEIKKKIFELPKFSPMSLDEAIKVLYKRGWMTRERRILNILFGMCRKMNLAFFMAIPNFWDLDPYYRSDRVKIWIYVPKRGRAILFIRNKNPFTEDPWNKKKNEKILDKYKGHLAANPEYLLTACKKMKIYSHSFTFPDLPPKLKQRYKELNMRAMVEVEEEPSEKPTTREEIYNRKIDLASASLIRKGWKATDVAKLFSVSADDLRKRLRKYKATPAELKKQDEIKEVEYQLSSPSSENVDKKLSEEKEDLIKQMFG